MIDRLIAELGEHLDLTAEEVADVIWLSVIRQQGQTVSKGKSNKTRVSNPREIDSGELNLPPPPIPLPISAKSSNIETETVAGFLPRGSTSDALMNRQPIKVANPPSIRDPLALVRSLRPLMRLVPCERVESLDEQATAQQIAEACVWQPVIKPVLEPWLDLILVLDESESMLIWRQTVLEFRKLLRNYGTFRDVHLWGLHWEDQQFKLRAGIGANKLRQPSRKPEALINPSGRQLILVISDCVAEYWRDERLVKLFKLWSALSSVAIVQVLPEWMWMRTAIRSYGSILLSANEVGLPNSRLTALWNDSYQAVSKSQSGAKSGAVIPIVPLDANAILNWSQMVMGHCEISGYLVCASLPETDTKTQVSLSPSQRIEEFQVMSSPIAQRLICLLAASPVVTLPVIRLIQETLLPDSRQMNVAEVLLGGLLRQIDAPHGECNPNELEYVFVDEAIRKSLLEETPVPETVTVLSKYIERQFDKSLDEFLADLMLWSQSENRELVEKARPFAMVTAAVLKRKGGKYRDFVRQIEQNYSIHPEPHLPIKKQIVYPALEVLEFTTAQLVESLDEVVSEVDSSWLPPLQTEEYNVAEITFDTETLNQPSIELEPFTFKVGYLVKLDNEWIVQKTQGQAYRYVERINEDVVLEMVSIAGGEFMMGSPAEELERYDDESPQHLVTVPDLYLGRYPVTQAQWRVVAAMPQVEQELKLDPSNFKGDNSPVEQVSWEDAIEFCARLSAYTNRLYRLPTEAEWEYACRAGTTTPFHFGEAISPELANYNSTVAYADSPTSEKRNETTPVDHFDIANVWGLCDMHGNVFQWCQDRWHDNYEGAPENGSAWISDDSENIRYVNRGGSWVRDPRYCRSAYRNYNFPDGRYYDLGFRVSCSAPETLPPSLEE